MAQHKSQLCNMSMFASSEFPDVTGTARCIWHTSQLLCHVPMFACVCVRARHVCVRVYVCVCVRVCVCVCVH